MKKLITLIIALQGFSYAFAQNNNIDQVKIKHDLDEILNNIAQNYTYLSEKNVDLNCLKEHYTNDIENIKTKEETILFFEYLLDEFYDNHLTLRTNTNSSFRLFAPIYVQFIDGKFVISNIWQTQIENLSRNIIGAEILEFNGIAFTQKIQDFPTHCHDKDSSEVKEWIANKIIAGRYSEPRILTLKLSNNREVRFDIDEIKIKEENSLLSSKITDNIGLIRINNSLGNDDLVSKFDETLDELSDTKGLILDLRNTLFGGDSYEARGIMSRFIEESRPYQKHSYIAKSQNNPDVERSWIEYVCPRLEAYQKPVIVLVGRWTGSMGEGLAIGFEGMERAEVVGTEMRRLAGEVYDFGFTHQWYGYKLSTAKLFHVNGTPREKYIPTHYIKQTTNEKDEILEKAIELISKMGK